MTLLRRTVAALLALSLTAQSADSPNDASKSASLLSGAVHIEIDPAKVLNSIVPIRCLGAGVDAVDTGAIEKIYTPANIAEMLASGHGALSYRLNTELSVEAWHWNPAGTWSDPAGRGYFCGSTEPAAPIKVSYGYDLPHRGNTKDQGLENGFSRLTDGDPASYWKSNPYLQAPFTKEDDALHPQWLIVDLGRSAKVNTIRIDWADPFATKYLVQYWHSDSAADPFDSPADGGWMAFENGSIQDGKGGAVTLPLAARPVDARYVRVLMNASSQTFDSHGPPDVRNSLGYAVCEVGVGLSESPGTFKDWVKHSPDRDTQTRTYVSSVDPWHDSSQKPTDHEQPGFDLIFSSGLTRGLPAMVPVAVLYNIPEDAAAEIRYLKARANPLWCVELGEEPDGQYISPEDYGALYLQFAAAIHAVDPAIPLGGPAFQSTPKIQTWADTAGETSWLKRFVAYLKAHGRSGDLAFFSFEHYPFEPGDGIGKKAAEKLLQTPAAIEAVLAQFRADGLPPGIPIYCTEYNFSAGESQVFQDLAGGLWHADFVGSFLSLGGKGGHYFEYEPTPAQGKGSNKGAFGMFSAGSDFHIRYRTSQFYSTQLLMKEWLSPTDAAHAIYPAACTVLDAKGNAVVSAYAVKRADETWAVMLIDKSARQPASISLDFRNLSAGTTASWSGPVEQIVFGAAQFEWHAGKNGGQPNPNLPPETTTLETVPDPLVLPKTSITVLRGHIRSRARN